MSFPFCPFLPPILLEERGGVSEWLAGAWLPAAQLQYDMCYELLIMYVGRSWKYN